MKIRKLFQKTIYLADPNVFIRKTNINFIHAMAASTLELRGLNLLEISSMNWKSTSIYVKFYSQPTLNIVLPAGIAGFNFNWIQNLSTR